MQQGDLLTKVARDSGAEHVGRETLVHQYCVVQSGAKIGKDGDIQSHCHIEDDVVIGDRVEIRAGVRICKGVRIENDILIGPGATFSDETWPRVGLAERAPTFVRNGASIGANASILPGVTIGEGAVVCAGAVVTRSVPPNAVVEGNPARIVRYTQSFAEPVRTAAHTVEADMAGKHPAVLATHVAGVTIHYLPVVRDMRGDLMVGEFSRDIPFVPKRYFMVYGVPSRETRGEHAHRTCHQFLVCVRGSCAVVVDDGAQRMEISLDSLAKGIYMPPMIWGIQYRYSSDAIVLVFASEYYDSADYIRDYADFIRERAEVKGGSAAIGK